MPSIFNSNVGNDDQKHTIENSQGEAMVEEHVNPKKDTILIRQRQRFIRYYKEFNSNINDISNKECEEVSKHYSNQETDDLSDMYCPSEFANSIDKYSEKKLLTVNKLIDDFINLSTSLNEDIYNLFAPIILNIQGDDCYELIDISSENKTITIFQHFYNILVQFQEEYNKRTPDDENKHNFTNSVLNLVISYLDDIQKFIIPVSKNLIMQTSHDLIFDFNDSRYNEKQFEFAFKKLIYNHLKLLKIRISEFGEKEETFKHSIDFIVTKLNQVIRKTLEIALMNDKCSNLLTSKSLKENETTIDNVPDFTITVTSVPITNTITSSSHTISRKSTGEVTSHSSAETKSPSLMSPAISNHEITSTPSPETIDNFSTTEINAISDKPTGRTSSETVEETFTDELQFFPTEDDNETSTLYNQDYIYNDNTSLTTTIWEPNQKTLNLTDLNQTGVYVVHNNTNVFMILGLVFGSIVTVLIVCLIRKGLRIRRSRKGRTLHFPLT